MSSVEQINIHDLIVTTFLKTDEAIQDARSALDKPFLTKTVRFNWRFFRSVQNAIGRIFERKYHEDLNHEYHELMFHMRHSKMSVHFFKAVLGISKDLVDAPQDGSVPLPISRKSNFTLLSPIGDPYLTFDVTGLKIELAPLAKSIHEEYGLNNPPYFFDDSDSMAEALVLMTEVPSIALQEKNLAKSYRVLDQPQ